MTSNAIRGGRPIHVPHGESLSMYANWNALPSSANLDPNIHVDSSVYGKKKSDAGSYVALASRRSASVLATSVESYKQKRQLILAGMNSFLPGEALRLVQSEAAPRPASQPTLRPPPVDGGFGPIGSSVGRIGSPIYRQPVRGTDSGIRIEDVSEDDAEEELEEVGCAECGRKYPAPKGRSNKSKAVFTCAGCLSTGRSRGKRSTARCGLFLTVFGCGFSNTVF